ncbi:hypothetical protein [Conexibacter sp. CPCC 206217]|uniref:hypothetical protein n=1 Tax=Conexibacter sp. CPCC 206217 TaxID=3064574 RepID=UPI0027197299|nr:hypothetical protein [Conexibacter sp. CPCC 206217]MDO8212419.1 hypothetical protein [Conexibacter sp. CPCC 206217]
MTANRARRAGAALALLGLVVFATSGSASASAAPAHLAASFGPDARLGQPTSLRLQLSISRRLPSPVTRIRIRYAQGLEIATSGLVLDECRRPPEDFARVMIPLTGRAACPANSVIATGTADGEVRLDTLTIRQTALMTILAGPLQPGQLQLVGLVEGVNPFGVLLAYSGALTPARPPYGGAISISLPPIPDLPYADASVALLGVDATIAASTIRYRRTVAGKVRRYRPDGIGLPSRCPAAGMRFRGDFVFADGTTASAKARAPCPPR